MGNAWLIDKYSFATNENYQSAYKFTILYCPRLQRPRECHRWRTESLLRRAFFFECMFHRATANRPYEWRLFPLTFCNEIIMLSRIYTCTFAAFIKLRNNGTFEPICAHRVCVCIGLLPEFGRCSLGFFFIERIV